MKKISQNQFNKLYPVGTKVKYYPIKGEAGFELTETRTPAWQIASGAVLVSVRGRAGGVSIEHIQIVAPDATESDKMSTQNTPPRLVTHVSPSVPQIRAEKDHVVVVFDVSHVPPSQHLQTLGIRFESPEHLLETMTQIMEKVVEVWPDHPLVKEYLSP